MLALALTARQDPGAIDAWRDLLRAAPDDAGAHLGLAMCLMAAQQTLAAARHFRAVVRALEGKADTETLPGPDALSVGWVRGTCDSLARRLEMER